MMLTRLPADERRAQLVESAIAVAERGGIAAVTVRGIAEHAGVSLGVVHYVFESKEALLAAMGESIVLQVSQSMHAAFGEASHHPEVRGIRGLRILLHRGLSAMWPLIEATPDRQKLSFELRSYSLRGASAADNSTATLMNAIASEQYQIMDREAVAFLNNCSERSGTTWLEPVAAVSRFGLALLDGLVLRWLVDRRSEAMLAQLDDMAGIIASKATEV